MSLWLTFRVALRALARNRLRTFLTALGIIIGVAAVIAMLAIGNGARVSVEKQIAGMGTHTLIIHPGSSRRGGFQGGRGTGRELTMEDVRAIAELPEVMAVSPVVGGGVQVIYGAQNWQTSLNGGSTQFLYVRNWPPERGRNFTEAEVRSAANVCLLGRVVARQLFGSADPVGETVRLNNMLFEVIGVLPEKGDVGGNARDDLVVVPYTTAQRKLLGTERLNAIIVSARSADLIDRAQRSIDRLLRQRHRVGEEEEDPFMIFSQAEATRAAGAATGVFILLLGSVASVSLLVGGIGIMNIMLVSVTERIREIGIRMAVGARPRDIAAQFLCEAVVLSVAGGALGVLLGVGLSFGIARFAQWPPVVSPGSIVLAFSFAALVGVVFGAYPAIKASRLDPIQALRHE
jgi:putative ABC transport system permease protein